MKNWANDIETVLERWQQLEMQQVVNFETFNHYAIVHHSTTIEGSIRAAKEPEIFRSFMAGQYKRFLQQEMDRYEAALKPPAGSSFFTLLA